MAKRKLSIDPTKATPETSLVPKQDPTPTTPIVSEAKAARLAKAEARATDPRRDPELRRRAAESAHEAIASIPSTQPCQCRNPECTAQVPVKRFAPGHDAKLFSVLLREAVELLAQEATKAQPKPKATRKAQAQAAA